MDFIFAFEPRLPVALIATLGAIGAVILVYGMVRGARGGWWRMAALAVVVFALLNPKAVEENREKLSDVAAIVVDASPSENIAGRLDRARAAARLLEEEMKALDGLEVRVVETRPSTEGTELFAALARALGDTPPDRIAGAVLITDGEVHDAPAGPPYDAPIHALITGEHDEGDRKLTLERAPRFGIVGEPVTLSVRVDDFGSAGTAPVDLTLSIDGRESLTRKLQPGVTESVSVTLPHGGENVVELKVGEGPRELTLLNNRAAAVINGVRDRLRVLLISGEPHAGERTWRNLLKADPAVDLVHFTILRPPEKQDNTPIEELSLISFPTQELFVEKLHEFDLVIFDRYRRRSILPPAYYANIAQYVENGGALLVASGKDYASPLSIYTTSLGAILPARPTGAMIERGFLPRVSADGARHPVTADLPQANAGAAAPKWGRWFRQVETEKLSGRELMTGDDGKPLLILDRVGEGRVALLTSDQAWLWTRGVEGGGPQAELLRRLAHWLMKEPELEEERLSGRVDNGMLRIERHSMEDTLPPVRVTAPDGSTKEVSLANVSPGKFTGEMPAEQTGLYRLDQGELTAVAASGPVNAREFEDVRATEDIVKPVVAQSGGGLIWLADNGSPGVRMVDAGRDASGGDWLGFRRNERYVVHAVTETELLHPLLAVVLMLGFVFAAWRAEGR